mgnify:CR=1 FL=1
MIYGVQSGYNADALTSQKAEGKETPVSDSCFDKTALIDWRASFLKSFDASAYGLAAGPS